MGKIINHYTTSALLMTLGMLLFFYNSYTTLAITLIAIGNIILNIKGNKVRLISKKQSYLIIALAVLFVVLTIVVGIFYSEEFGKIMDAFNSNIVIQRVSIITFWLLMMYLYLKRYLKENANNQEHS